MIRLQTDVDVDGLAAEEVFRFLLNCDDASYQAWWPGIHIRFHTVLREPGNVGNLVYMDEYIGRFRLRLHAVIVAIDPGRRIVWQMVKGVRLPGRLLLTFEDRPGGVRISHRLEAGSAGAGRIFDPVIRLWLTKDLERALDAHVRAEFPRLRDLLRSGHTPAVSA